MYLLLSLVSVLIYYWNLILLKYQLLLLYCFLFWSYLGINILLQVFYFKYLYIKKPGGPPESIPGRGKYGVRFSLVKLMEPQIFFYSNLNVRLCLFWVKITSGNHFPPNPHAWLSRKMIFSEKWLPIDQYFHLWPGNDFLPSFSLQSISGKRKRERESARARERRRNRTVSRSPGGADLQSELQAAPINSPSSRRRHLAKIAAKIAISRHRDIAIWDRDREIALSRARTSDRDRRRDLRSRSTARDRAVARSRSQIDRDLAPLIARSCRRDRDRWWYFSWVCVFLLLFQTPENIFWKIFWNATNHSEIFSFSGN